MDVAVFAGFASTGPLHVPVLVTSVPQFASVFGRDAPLAWDARRGEPVLAHLGGAVRGFFANGGRRCWVIRVARSEALETVRRELRPELETKAVAQANLFPVAGVLEISSRGDVTPALVRARSEGSWSDGVRLATALQQRTLGIVDLVVDAPARRLEFRTRQRPSSGELVELRDGSLRAFAVVVDSGITSAEVAHPYHVAAQYCAGFEGVDPATSPPLQLAGEVGMAGLDLAPFATLEAAPAAGDFLLRFAVDASHVPQPSQWLRFTDGTDVFWIQARAVTQVPMTGASPGGALLTESDVRVQGPAWRELAAMPATVQADRVFSSSLELRAEDRDDDDRARLVAGLSPGTADAWWQQTTDEQLFRALDGRVDTLAGPEQQLARFPLAPMPGAAPLAWIPLGVDALFSDGLGPLPATATALERDGLADFDAALFLDPELAGLATDEVAPRAELIRFLREQPRALFGVHAALSIGAGGLFGECSLLCVPDAVHLGWRRYEPGDAPEPDPEQGAAPAHWSTHRGPCVPANASPLEAPDHGVFLDCGTRALSMPVLSGPAGVVTTQAYQLRWTESEPHAEYELSESLQADLSDARTIYSGDQLQFTIPPRDGVYYYRVFARSGDERSADSNVAVVQVRRQQWLQLEPETFAPDGELELLRLQRAVLRLAASNGEMFVILSLPRDYRAPAAVRFAGRLCATAGLGIPGNAEAFAVGEARTLSYGALYHPWLVSASLPPPALAPATAASPPRALPPEGAIAGTFAARASGRGAWIAPANERLSGVVALTPVIEPESWQSLQDAAVNVVRDDASGFMTLSADTLSQDFELRMINVRRLLILLRRLALRRGTSYVFEPNGPTLRRAVQRGFDVLLGDLFRRGAFAGRTEESSFQVVTDDTVNTPLDNDAGRFIVELRIAPSMPMRFLTLLLAQSGERLTVTEEL